MRGGRGRGTCMCEFFLSLLFFSLGWVFGGRGGEGGRGVWKGGGCRWVVLGSGSVD